MCSVSSWSHSHPKLIPLFLESLRPQSSVHLQLFNSSRRVDLFLLNHFSSPCFRSFSAELLAVACVLNMFVVWFLPLFPSSGKCLISTWEVFAVVCLAPALVPLNTVVCAASLTKTEADSVYEFRRLPLSQVTIPHANYAKAVNTTSRIMIIGKICPSSLWNNKHFSSQGMKSSNCTSTKHQDKLI